MCTSLWPRGCKAAGLRHLAADAELLDEIQIRLAVTLRDVAQQTAAFADHLQQTTAGHVIVLVRLQVFSQFLDAFSQNGHLHAGAARVILMHLRAFDGGSLFLTCDHVHAF